MKVSVMMMIHLKFLSMDDFNSSYESDENSNIDDKSFNVYRMNDETLNDSIVKNSLEESKYEYVGLKGF